MALLRLILKQIGPEERGQALVEYALILSLVALIAIPSLLLVEGGVDGLYNQVKLVADAISGALGS